MSKHMKRLAAPRSWVIPRKTNVYTTKPRPGAHPVERALPLATVVRDFLKLTETGREARRVIGAGDVLVDGRIVKDAKFAVGFQDVVSVPKTKQAWRVFIDDKARLRIVAIAADQAAWKLAQITGKTTVTGGRTQLNFHDGRNLLRGLSGVVEQGERPVRALRHQCQRNESPAANVRVLQIVCHPRHASSRRS